MLEKVNFARILDDGSAGDFATGVCELRQDWKVATVADCLCADDLLAEPLFTRFSFSRFTTLQYLLHGHYACYARMPYLERGEAT